MNRFCRSMFSAKGRMAYREKNRTRRKTRTRLPAPVPRDTINKVRMNCRESATFRNRTVIPLSSLLTRYRYSL